MNDLQRAGLFAGSGLALAVLTLFLDGRLGIFLGAACFIGAVALEVIAIRLLKRHRRPR